METKIEIVRARVDARQKARAVQALKKRGLTLSAFLRAKIYELAETSARSMRAKSHDIPNAITAKAIRDFESGADKGTKYATVNDALDELWK